MIRFMHRLAPALLFAAAALPTGAAGDVPAVAADIPPVHSLVARVMGDLGEPVLAVRPGTSPHGHAMRPSEAAALRSADLVVWVGPSLAAWFGEAVGNLSDARSLPLEEVAGTRRLPARETAIFAEAHDHDHDEAHHGHAAGGIDPHTWLAPANARLWLDAIAAALSEIDPENAEAYRRNAQAGLAEIDAATADADAVLAPVRDVPFLAVHDAYQYFEEAFGLAAAGAIVGTDAVEPGAARVADLRDLVERNGIACLVDETAAGRGIAATIAAETGARRVTVDPLGAALEAGPGLYPALLRGMAEDLAGCLR
jgi:zinc transport system substrate-binding protein